MRRSILLLGFIVAVAALAGCGQKGPLVRPGGTPASAHSAPPPSATPLPEPIPSDDGSGR